MRYFSEVIKEMQPRTFFIGESESGDFVFCDIENTPHLFVSGVTGSGKSAFIQSLLLSAMLKNKVEDLRFLLFDSKMVELNNFSRSSHMFYPTITDFKKLNSALQWMVLEIYRRLRLFVKCGVKSIAEYRDFLEELDLELIPRIVIVLDDLSAALKYNPDMFEPLGEILMKGRTVGIHLIVVTQHVAISKAKELAKLIPTKVLFLTLSEKESRMLIGNSAAFNQSSPGNAVYSAYRGEAVKIKTVLPSPEESKAILSISKKMFQGYNEDIDTFLQGPCETSFLQEPNDEDNDAELVCRAVDIILEAGQASTSVIQKRLNLGYSRAASIIDQLEEKGYIGPFEGAVPRTVLITKEQWMKVKKEY